MTAAETIASIISGVCNRHGVTLDQLIAKDRSGRIVAARHEVYARLREAGFSLPRIGRKMKRDHKTVHSGSVRYWAAMKAAE